MMLYIRHLISRLFTFGEDKEQLILEVLGNEEMFGFNLVRASEGRLGRGGIHGILADMEYKGLLTHRDIKKTVTIKETMDGKVHERKRVIKQRLYRRGIPPARVL